MDELVKLLKSFECHFNWNLDDMANERDTCPSIQEKVAVKNEEISGHPWRHIVLDSVLCYEDSKSSPSSADQKIHECMTSIASDQDPFVKKHKVAFENVLNAFKAHLALLNSTVSKTQELAKKVVPYSEMSPEEKAAVMGFKANVIMEYGREGTTRALEFGREAVKCDPSEPEWHFLVGKILQRIRNFKLLKTPSEEERTSLEKAFEMSSAPHHAMFLSTCLHNVSSTIYYSIPLQHGKRNISPKEALEMDALNRRCVSLLEHAAKGNPDCPHNLIRVARGFYALPKEFNNLPYAQKLVDVCLEKAPDNAMVHVVASLISHRFGETERAIKYAKKAGELGAYGGYIRFFDLQVDAKVNFDEEALYKFIINKFNSPLDVGKTYLHATCFYLFVKNDHSTSFEYFKKALDSDYDLHDIMKTMYVRWIKDTVNLYDLMYNEAKVKVNDMTDELGADHPKLKIPRCILFKIAMVSSTSTERAVDPHLVKRLVDNSTFRRRGRERGRGRGRGSGRGRGGNRGSRGGGDRGRGGGGRGRGGSYMSVSLSANRSRGRSRSSSNERVVKVKSRGDKSFREITTEWTGSSDSLCSNNSRQSNSREDLLRRERERSRGREQSSRIRRFSEGKEVSLKPDSDSEEHKSSSNKIWRAGCGGWRNSLSTSQEKLDSTRRSPGSLDNKPVELGQNKSSFRKSSESLDNWRYTGGSREPFKRSTESLDSWRSPNQRQDNGRTPSYSWRATSSRELPKHPKPIEPKLDSNTPRFKTKLDELKKTASNPTNVRRSDLLAMFENMKLEPRTGKTSNLSSLQDSQPSRLLLVSPSSDQNPSKQKSPTLLHKNEPRLERRSHGDTVEVAKLRAAVLEQLSGANAVNTKPREEESRVLPEVSNNGNDSSNRESFGTPFSDETRPAGADDILTSFIRRKFISKKGDDESDSDGSVDSDYDARL